MQRSGDESAVLWLDQIQEAIHTANQDQEDALKCTIKSTFYLNITLILHTMAKLVDGVIKSKIISNKEFQIKRLSTVNPP